MARAAAPPAAPPEPIIDGIRASIVHLAIPIGQIRQHPRNPNHGDIAAIMGSIKVHGQYAPVVYNARKGALSEGCIIKGNHTYEAMRQLGHSRIAAIADDVDDDEAASILIADNRISDKHETDPRILADLLATLPEPTLGTGFSQTDMDELLASLTTQQGGFGAKAGDPLAGMDPGEGRYKEQYGVIVVCADEAEQQAVYERLLGEGLACKVVVT